MHNRTRMPIAAGAPPFRDVTVGALLTRCLGEPLDDVGRGTDLRVSTAEIDKRFAVGLRRLRHSGEQRREVLLGKAVEPFRPGPHQQTGG